MNEYNVGPWYVRVMMENMGNRLFSVNGSSKCYPLTRGICQGSANGPLSLSLHSNSTSKVITCSYYMDADDITIYTEGKTLREINKRLKIKMENIMEWCKENCMSINIDNTQMYVFP